MGAGSQAVPSTFRGWVLNTRNLDLTEYTNYPFNSFAVFNGTTYGAGAAGIAAARTAHALGKTCVVLEARHRVGGRAFTDTSLGIPYDAGAAYIHFADRNPWVREAKRLGIETRLWRGWTHHEAWQSGAPLSEDQIAERRDGYGEFWDHLETLGESLTDRSIAEAAHHLSPSAREAARHFSRLALGEEPSRLSLHDYQVQWAGPDRVIPSGYGTLVAAAAWTDFFKLPLAKAAAVEGSACSAASEFTVIGATSVLPPP